MREAVTVTLGRDPAEPRWATYQDVLDAPPHRVAEIALHLVAEHRRRARFERPCR